MSSRPLPTGPRPHLTGPTWSGDPAILVFAVRYTLGRRGSHGPELVRQALAENATRLPQPAKKAIEKDVTAWLAGAGSSAAGPDRAVWLSALASLGVPA